MKLKIFIGDAWLNIVPVMQSLSSFSNRKTSNTNVSRIFTTAWINYIDIRSLNRAWRQLKQDFLINPRNCGLLLPMKQYCIWFKTNIHWGVVTTRANLAYYFYEVLGCTFVFLPIETREG
jgi:hypothetical protein